MKPIKYPIAGPEELDREQREFLEQLYRDSGGRPLSTDVPAITLAIIMANSTWAVAQAEWAATRIRLGATTREAVNNEEWVRRGTAWRPDEVSDATLREVLESNVVTRYVSYARPGQDLETFLTTEMLYAKVLTETLGEPEKKPERAEVTESELRELLSRVAGVSAKLYKRHQEQDTYVVPKNPGMVSAAREMALWGVLNDELSTIPSLGNKRAFLEGIARRLAPQTEDLKVTPLATVSTNSSVVFYRRRMSQMMGLPPTPHEEQGDSDARDSDA